LLRDASRLVACTAASQGVQTAATSVVQYTDAMPLRRCSMPVFRARARGCVQRRRRASAPDRVAPARRRSRGGDRPARRTSASRASASDRAALRAPAPCSTPLPSSAAAPRALHVPTCPAGIRRPCPAGVRRGRGEVLLLSSSRHERRHRQHLLHHSSAGALTRLQEACTAGRTSWRCAAPDRGRSFFFIPMA
jgi:hypothetical protein